MAEVEKMWKEIISVGLVVAMLFSYWMISKFISLGSGLQGNQNPDVMAEG